MIARPKSVLDVPNVAGKRGGSRIVDGIGPGRAQFEREVVADLRKRLRDAGADLVVSHGRPDEVLPELLERVDADRLYCQTLADPDVARRASLSRSRDRAGGAVEDGHEPRSDEQAGLDDFA